jgi:hypothetical protein
MKGYQLRFAASRFDLLFGAGRKAMGPHGYGLGPIALAQNFYLTILTANQAMFSHGFRNDFAGAGKSVQLRQINHGHFIAKNVMKAALGQAALQRHLATFKTRLGITAGTRALSFVSTARSLTMPRAIAPTDPFAFLVRTSGWFQIVKSHI